MGWSRCPLAPVVPLQEAVDGAAMHGVAKLLLQGLLELVRGGDLSFGGTVEEGGKEGVFFRRREVGIPPPAFAWCGEGRGT